MVGSSARVVKASQVCELSENICLCIYFREIPCLSFLAFCMIYFVLANRMDILFGLLLFGILDLAKLRFSE